MGPSASHAPGARHGPAGRGRRPGQNRHWKTREGASLRSTPAIRLGDLGSASGPLWTGSVSLSRGRLSQAPQENERRHFRSQLRNQDRKEGGGGPRTFCRPAWHDQGCSREESHTPGSASLPRPCLRRRRPALPGRGTAYLPRVTSPSLTLDPAACIPAPLLIPPGARLTLAHAAWNSIPPPGSA